MINPTLKADNGQVIATAVGQRIEKREPMTRLRKRIAERLLSATQETAMLTTFNEVNMKPLMDCVPNTKIVLRSVMALNLALCHYLLRLPPKP